MDYIKNVDNYINSILTDYVKKPDVIRAVVHLLLVLYAAKLAPSLPPQAAVLFENSYFRLFIYALILWTAQFSPATSLLIAICFMVTVNFINQKPLWEFMENIETQTPAPEAPTVAPSKETAVLSSAAIVENQLEQTPMVTSVSTPQSAVVIQPTIVQTTEGPTVVTPNVVVAPAVVSTPSGEKVVIKPDITVVEATTTPAPTATPAAVQPAEKAEEKPTEAEGCYPLRRYDMSKVSAFDDVEEYQTL
jgi:hypothetical protein